MFPEKQSGMLYKAFPVDINILHTAYCKVFKAEAICMLHPYQIFIPEESGKYIRKVYDYEWTEDIV